MASSYIGVDNPEQDPVKAIIGGAIMAAGAIVDLGFIGNMKTYEQNIAPEMDLVNGLNNQFATDSDRVAGNMNISLANQAGKVSGQIGAGMSARGISSPAAQDYAKTAYAGSISGAYAAANAALQGAKVNAQNSLDKTVSGYYQDVASAQLHSVLQKQALQRGLYGTLALAGGKALSAGIGEAFSGESTGPDSQIGVFKDAQNAPQEPMNENPGLYPSQIPGSNTGIYKGGA